MDNGLRGSTGPLCSDDTSSETGAFECNICFELAQDPIVTLCGHLYCWPCLYVWLHIHSFSHECPVCKALVQEEKLVPLYGRGKTSSDLGSRSIPGVIIPRRPLGQRPETAPPPPPDIDSFRHNEFGQLGGFIPTFSAFIGAILSLFNLRVRGFHNATVYGSTIGVPRLFTGSYHGGYARGFHRRSTQGREITSVIKTLLLLVCFLTFLSINSSLPEA